MSTLVSITTGNFTSSSTWGVVDTTSYLDSEAATQAVNTSPVDCAAFTPGAVTIAGIALKLQTRTASPSGTLTVTLRNSSLGSNVISVTINVSDLTFRGWHYFKFSSPQLLLAATNYVVRLQTSVGGNIVTFYRNSTSGNVARLLVTSSTAAPGSGDQLIIAGEWTAAGTGSDHTVTMDNTATTSFGPTVSGGPPQGVYISARGRMVQELNSSTNYVFKWKGVLAVAGGGILRIGQSGSPLPSNSTAEYFMDSATNVDTGIEVLTGGVVTIQGVTKTIKTTLDADAASSATNITVGSTSNWEANDVLALMGTSTYSHTEEKSVSSIGGATAATIGALTNDHSGTSPTKADIINLTHRLKIHGASSSLRGYIYVDSAGSLTLQYAEIYYMGSTTTNKRGIESNVTSLGVFNVQYISYYSSGANTNAAGAVQFGSNTPSGVVFSNSAVYKMDGPCLVIPSTATSGWTFENNIFASAGQVNGNASVALILQIGGVFKNNICTSLSNNVGDLLSIQVGSVNTSYTLVEADWTGNKIYCSNAGGVRIGNNYGLSSNNQFSSFDNSVIDSWDIWNTGIATSIPALNIVGVIINNLIIKNTRIFGNTDSCIGTDDVPYTIVNNLYGYNCTFGASTAVSSTPYGLRLQGHFTRMYFESCDFGKVSTGIGAFSTGDIVFNQAKMVAEIRMYNCYLSSGVFTGLQSGNGAFQDSFVKIEKYSNTAGDHRTYTPAGTIKTDTVIYDTASPSARLIPVSASVKLKSGSKFIPVANGNTVTVSCRVRKSSSGDAGGADYNGNQPRLILKRNDGLGVTSDTVLATYASAVGSFNTLSGTTSAISMDGVYEVYVDCDGTAGWINIDDWAVA